MQTEWVKSEHLRAQWVTSRGNRYTAEWGLSLLGLRRTEEDRHGLQAYCCHGDRWAGGLLHQCCNILRRRMTRTANRCVSCHTCHSVAAPQPCSGWSCCPRSHGACVGCPWALSRPLCDMRGREGAARPTTGQKWTSGMCLLFSALGGVNCEECHLAGAHGSADTKKVRERCGVQNANTQSVTVSMTPLACSQGCRVEGYEQGSCKTAHSLPPLCAPVWNSLRVSPCLHNTEPNGFFCWVSRSLEASWDCPFAPHPGLTRASGSFNPTHSLYQL